MTKVRSVPHSATFWQQSSCVGFPIWRQEIGPRKCNFFLPGSSHFCPQVEPGGANRTTLKEKRMKKIFGNLMLACVLTASMAAFAQDQMKQDTMKPDDAKQDTMKQDTMKNDQMKKDKKSKKAKKDAMKKDDMKKDSMKDDNMKKDDMKHDEMKSN